MALRPSPASIAAPAPSTPPNASDEVEGSRIKSLTMSIRLLTAMAAVGGPIGVSELARRVGESKARIHRHLLTLRDAGILIQGGDERYRLGWMLFDLGQAAAAQFDIASIAAPAMRELRDATRLTVMLGQRTGDEVIVSQTVDSESMIAVTVRKGLRVSAHGSSMGRVMLAFTSPEEQQRILAKRLTGATGRTLVDKAAVRERLAHIRVHHWEVAAGESQHGVSAIASPLLDAGGSFVGVLAIIGTQPQIGDPPDRALIERVERCAKSISGLIGAPTYANGGAAHATSRPVKPRGARRE